MPSSPAPSRSSGDGKSRPSTTDKSRSSSKGADGSALVSPYLQSTRLLASFSPPASKAAHRLQQKAFDAAFEFSNRSAVRTGSPLRPASQPGSAPYTANTVTGHGKSAPSSPASKQRPRHKQTLQGDVSGEGRGTSSAPQSQNLDASCQVHRAHSQPCAPTMSPHNLPHPPPPTPPPQHIPHQQLPQQQQLLRTGAAGRLLQAYGQPPTISPYTQRLTTPSTPDPAHHHAPAASAACGSTLAHAPSLTSPQRSSAGSGRSSNLHGQGNMQGHGEGPGGGSKGASRGRAYVLGQGTAFGRGSLEPQAPGKASSRSSSIRSPEGLPKQTAPRQSNSSAGARVPTANDKARGQSMSRGSSPAVSSTDATTRAGDLGAEAVAGGEGPGRALTSSDSTRSAANNNTSSSSNNSNKNSGSDSGSHLIGRPTGTPALPHPPHQQLQQHQQHQPTYATARPPSQPSEGAPLRSSQQMWQPAPTAMSEVPPLSGTLERPISVAAEWPQAPATASQGSFRRSRRGDWPSSHDSSPRDPMAKDNARSMHRSASGAFAAEDADDPMDGAVSDDYLEDAPLTGNSIDIPVVVTDGPTVVRVVSTDVGNPGRARESALGSSSRPPSALGYHAAHTGLAPGPNVLGRKPSRPPSAAALNDSLAHTHAWPPRLNGSGGRGSRPSSGKCPWILTPGQGDQEPIASPSAPISPSLKRSLEGGGGVSSPSSASGMQYEDIPDVPWEEGEESWTEAAEEDEAADPAYQGLTLASYMSKLVTTPASPAATSGLSGHHRQGGAALQAAPPSPKPPHSPSLGSTAAATTPSPPPLQPAWPSQAPPYRGTQPTSPSSGLSNAPPPSMLNMPHPPPPPPPAVDAGAAGGASLPSSMPRTPSARALNLHEQGPSNTADGTDHQSSLLRTPSARALSVQEQGPFPWHHPSVDGSHRSGSSTSLKGLEGRNLMQLGNQQQQQQQQQQLDQDQGEVEEEEETPDPQLPSCSDSDSLASLGAQVPRWQDDDDESEDDGSIQEGLAKEDGDSAAALAQAKPKPDGLGMWRKGSVDENPPKLNKSQPLERGPHSGSMGPLHTMPIVSGAAAALSNSLDLRPATASASYSLTPARHGPPLTPPSPSSSSTSPQGASPSSSQDLSPSAAHTGSPSHAHKQTHSHRHHHHHFREPCVSESGHVKEVDLGGLSSELFSYSSSSNKASSRRQLPVPLQVQLEQGDIKVRGLYGGDTGPNSNSSVQSLGPPVSSFSHPQSASSRERGGSSSTTSAHPAAPAPPVPNLAHSTSLGRAPTTDASTPDGIPHSASMGRAPMTEGAVQAPAAHSPSLPSPTFAPPGTATATRRRSSEFSKAGHLLPQALPTQTSPHLFSPSPPSMQQQASHSSSMHSVAGSAVHACLQQPAPQAPRELHPVRPPPRLAFDANGSLSTSSEAGPLTRNQQSSSELSTLLPLSPGAWAQRVAHPTPEGQQTGEPTAALAAATAASMMRPVAPPPGGVRAVQSARPITRSGPAPDFSVWQGFIAQQLERPPSRQKPPPEALHLWSPEESRSTLLGLPNSGSNTDLNSSYHAGPRLRARPHSAMVTLGGHGRSILSGAALRAQPANVPYGSMAGQHARPPTRERPPTRQRPPPMALLLEHREEDGGGASSQEDGIEGGLGGVTMGRKGARRGRGHVPSAASVQELSSDSSDE